MSERELDLLIDSALPAYVAEPTPGLADRVVARARRRRIGWLPVAGAVAAAALFAFAWWPRPAAVPAPTNVTASRIQPSLTNAAPRAKEGESVVLRRPRRAVSPPPVRPVPIRPEELRLALFVAQYPELAQRILTTESQGPVEPLSEPEPIEIQPLDNY
jgi:hypothetical protein